MGYFADINRWIFHTVYPHGVNPLPTGTVLILFCTHVLNSCCITMVFSYIPEMMRTFGVEEVKVGLYAGWVASALFIGRIFSSLLWGLMVDRFSSKVASIAAATSLSGSTLLFGFSNSFPWAFCTRFIQGLSMGLVVSFQVMIYEISDGTNQAYGLTVLVTAYTVGSVLGPSIGGFLVLPSKLYPTSFPKNSLFDTYKFLLPNLIIAVLLALSAIVMSLFLPNPNRSTEEEEPLLKLDEGTKSTSLRETDNNEKAFQSEHEVTQSKSLRVMRKSLPSGVDSKYTVKGFTRLRRVLQNRDTVSVGLLYFVHVIPVTGYREAFPMFASTEAFYNGLGYNPSEIGLVLLISASLILVGYPLVSVRVAKALGARKLMILGCFLMIFVYPLTPIASGIRETVVQKMLLVTIYTITQGSASFCYTAVNIFQNNSVPAYLLGTANGFGVMMSVAGRSLSPVLIGSMYSWSLNNVKSAHLNALGYPFNQYFTFEILAVMLLVCAFWTACLSQYLEHRRDQTTDK